jgi:hypothetical protein
MGAIFGTYTEPSYYPFRVKIAAIIVMARSAVKANRIRRDIAVYKQASIKYQSGDAIEYPSMRSRPGEIH